MTKKEGFKTMNKKINGCPYKSSGNGTCSHRECKSNRKGKRYCGYEYPHNCEMFRKWLSIKEKSKIEGLE